MKKKTMAIWATVIAASVCLGALSGAQAAEPKQAEPPAGWLTAEQTMTEFKEISQNSELALPEGVDWPLTPPAELADSEGLFEAGFVDSVANLYALCAWEETLVEATSTTNARGMSEGLVALETFASSGWFTDNEVDPDGYFRAAVLEPALNGDLSGVEAELANCGYYHLNQ